jgi:hypothetical protein
MCNYNPLTIIGFHSCDKEVGLRILNGRDTLLPSKNSWDWLGNGIYFWENDPLRAIEYASECSQRKQFNRIPIRTPFVVGAIIDLKNCFNLIEKESLSILNPHYNDLKKQCYDVGKEISINNQHNRALDCQVIQYIHQLNSSMNATPYDTVRCAFPEGEQAYPGSSITSRLHIQVCVRNPECIKGVFLPQPLTKYNPSFN